MRHAPDRAKAGPRGRFSVISLCFVFLRAFASSREKISRKGFRCAQAVNLWQYSFVECGIRPSLSSVHCFLPLLVAASIAASIAVLQIQITPAITL